MPTKPSTIQTTVAAPAVHFPPVKVLQSDGSILVKPGRPVLLDFDYVGTQEAAKMLGLSQRTIEQQCDMGDFATAFKPGGKPGSRWKISRSEVLSRISQE